MAGHDDPVEETDSVNPAEAVDEVEADDVVRRRFPPSRWSPRAPGPVAAGLAVVVTLAGLGGWLAFRLHQDREVDARRNLYVQVARQTAVNLTTISYTEVDADIKRVLDSATGGFHDEFENRSKPFVEVVKKVQSRSEGSISEAGLVSDSGDQAQVLVAVAVKTSMGTAPADPEPRRWRMRLTVDRTGDSAKVSNVEFVP